MEPSEDADAAGDVDPSVDADPAVDVGAGVAAEVPAASDVVVGELVGDCRNQTFDQRNSLGESQLVDRGHQLAEPRVIHPLGFLARCHLPLR